MDVETDGQTDMMQLIIAFRNFAKMPKNMDKTGVTSYFITPPLRKVTTNFGFLIKLPDKPTDTMHRTSAPVSFCNKDIPLSIPCGAA